MAGFEYPFFIQMVSADTLKISFCGLNEDLRTVLNSDGQRCDDTLTERFQAQLPEVTEVVCGYNSLLMTFDLIQSSATCLMAKLNREGADILGGQQWEQKDEQKDEPKSDAKVKAEVFVTESEPTSGFHVIHPGLMSCFQAGSVKSASRGGAVDEHAFLWANHLLQNAWNAGAIEVSFGGLKLQSQVDTLIAVTGADLNLTINDDPAPCWEILPIRAGDRIEFGYPKSGTRSYLAVKGGLNFSPDRGILTADSDDPSACEQAVPGRDVSQRQDTGLADKLNFGDLLTCQEQDHRSDKKLCHLIGKRVSNTYLPDYRESLVLRIIPADREGCFEPDQLKRFLEQVWEIKPDNDRAEVVLSGNCTLKACQGEILPEGTQLGRVQLQDDGDPVILLQDREALTVRPALGYVYPPDLWQLAQRQPKTRVQFTQMSLFEAQLQLTRFYRYFR